MVDTDGRGYRQGSMVDTEWWIQNGGYRMVDTDGRGCRQGSMVICLAEWEREVLPLCPLKPDFYGRFLDDVFIVWTYTLDEFWTFFNILNNHHPSVKLTANVSHNSIDFLDTTVFKSNNTKITGQLETKVFFKETDTHQLLFKSSFHPKHTFSGIIKSQILRFHRICTQKTDFESACTLVFSKLRERGYSKRYLRRIKNNTLAELAAKETNNIQSAHKTKICGHPRCQTCKILNISDHFHNKTSGTKFPILDQLSCSSLNIIYLILCRKCDKQYVGETQNALRERINGHRSDIVTKKDKPVSIHFNQPNHDISDLIVTPKEKTKSDFETSEEIKTFRLTREKFWIDKLKTTAPLGLNIHTASAIAPFVVPFSATAASASKIIRKHYTDLQENHPKIFTQKLIIAYSKNKNLNDILVHSKLD
ncbi:uncharacterized protein LOC130014223 [Patella vulgata]|uniref:uncharacterized protein LOC130014223 n=1 Tax=Patella vulgata TaxID=6465 RepID=UPI0024A8FE03|nr:uncharacterized protein LOC130014223 [Patella vulgata]XP_055959088.1 uncharacterized protein LOC130014223 [Patella vulgata]